MPPAASRASPRRTAAISARVPPSEVPPSDWVGKRLLRQKARSRSSLVSPPRCKRTGE